MGQKSIFLAIGLIIFAVILVAFFVASRLQSGSKTENKTQNTQSVSRNLVPVAEIVNSPLVYEGYNLEVDSEISDWVTNKSFTFVTGGSTFGGAGKQLLVIAKQPFQLPQDPDDAKVGLGEKAKVTVRGKVQILNREELQLALGVDLDGAEIALDNNNINKWGMGPVLFADTVEIDKNSSK